MNKDISINTTKSLMIVLANKCDSCGFRNICLHTMKESCADEIINEQLKLITNGSK